MNRRRPLLRAFGMGGASLVVAGVLVVGVGVPANAVDLSIHSYRLSYPTSVTDSAGASDAFAWRDVARDYSTRVPIAPASPVVTLGKAGANLYGTGAGIQLVNAGGSYTQRITGADAWPASAGKPSHVLQSEWDACSGGSKSLVSELRSIATAKLGGVNCSAVKAGWGAKVADAWNPIGGPPAHSFPVRQLFSMGERWIDVGVPIWNGDAVPGGVSRAWGYLYPVELGGEPWNSSHTFGLAMRMRSATNTGFTASLRWSSLYQSTVAIPSVPTSASPLLPGSYCGSAWACFHPGFYGVNGTTVAAGQYPVAVGVTASQSSGTAATGLGTKATDFLDYPRPASMVLGPSGGPVGCGGLSGCGGWEDLTGDAPVKVATTATYADGTQVTCTSDGFLQKAGERIPLPCEPMPAAGHNYGPEVGRLVELVPATQTGYVYGSDPSREVAKVVPSQPIKDYAAAHPECASTRCTLDLVKSGVSCFDRPTGCENWKDETSTGTGHGYECKYGGKAVALSECDVYGPVFSAENRDAGHAYGPPAGGGGGETSAPHNPGAGPGGSECFPNGYGPANPVEHVLVPVTCALKDSFVPRGFVLGEAAGQVSAAAESVGVGKLGSALGSLGDTFAIGSTCVGGLPFRFELFGSVIVDARIFDACAPPWDGIAPFVKNTLGALLLGSVVLAGARYLAAAFGFVGISTGIGSFVSQQNAANERAASKAGNS